MTNSTMPGHTFTSPDENFSLNLPLDWEEYDSEEERTFAFFNSKSWTGNLRITPLYWNKPNDAVSSKADELIEDHIFENEGAVKLKMGSFNCAHYKKDVQQDGDMFVVYFWVLGQKNTLFMCSLTIDKAQENTTMNNEVLAIVKNIIKSIKLN
jgi:hypothetical protein